MLRHLAELWALGSLIMLLLIVPHFFACLFIWERDHRVRYCRRHRDSGYYYSLKSWSWYMRIAAVGMLLLMCLYLLRVVAEYEPLGAPLPPQPAWSYLASMVTISLLVLILWMPGFFLLWIKYTIRHDRRIGGLSNEEITTTS